MRQLLFIGLILLTGAVRIIPAEARWEESRWVSAGLSGVTDGDTVAFTTTEGSTEHIRLVAIDAPEKDQPYGLEATRALSHLVMGKKVHVELTGVDKYGRYLSVVWAEDNRGRPQCVNLQMVELGLAWRYGSESLNNDLIKSQVRTQIKKRGLWADELVVEPNFEFCTFRAVVFGGPRAILPASRGRSAASLFSSIVCFFAALARIHLPT